MNQLREFAKESTDFVFEHKKWIVLLVAAFFLLMLFQQYVKQMVFIALLIALASVSMFYNRYIRLTLGFELVMLATVLCGVAYGAGVGIFVGIVSLFLAELVSAKIAPQTIVSFIGIAIIGLIAHFFAGMSITAAGIILTLIYDAIILPLYLTIGVRPETIFTFAITHILWNVWVFFSLAPLIFGMMV